MKLKPLFLTKKERAESEDIANKTKAEIMTKIQELDLEAVQIFEAECVEVIYFASFKIILGYF